ncbi:hypothetical protein EZV62_000320 [Acer yangbiense]|uniref:Uncharacterized protein n=1 Tax=Acer yangbiense TaxID=1000413 RepID=A0A5C7IR18_9ROSI|nr:hypothetical protein EZV62_000320 [Acer yangbiense]
MYTQTCNITKNIATKLNYYDNMFKLESKATLISNFEIAFSRAFDGCRPYVEYKGTAPQSKLQSKPKELELEANAMISRGGKVSFTYFSCSRFVLLYYHMKKLPSCVMGSFLIIFQR